jgi:hypothetical protein
MLLIQIVVHFAETVTRLLFTLSRGGGGAGGGGGGGGLSPIYVAPLTLAVQFKECAANSTVKNGAKKVRTKTDRLANIILCLIAI